MSPLKSTFLVRKLSISNQKKTFKITFQTMKLSSIYTTKTKCLLKKKETHSLMIYSRNKHIFKLVFRNSEVFKHLNQGYSN